MRTMYVVMAETHEYSDSQHWIVAVYDDAARAQRHVDAAEADLSVVKDWLCEKCDDGVKWHAPLDRYAGCKEVPPTSAHDPQLADMYISSAWPTYRVRSVTFEEVC